MVFLHLACGERHQARRPQHLTPDKKYKKDDDINGTRPRRTRRRPDSFENGFPARARCLCFACCENPLYDGIIAGPPFLTDHRSLSPAIEMEAWRCLPAYSGQRDEKIRNVIPAKNFDALFFFFSISSRDTFRMPVPLYLDCCLQMRSLREVLSPSSLGGSMHHPFAFSVLRPRFP